MLNVRQKFPIPTTTTTTLYIFLTYDVKKINIINTTADYQQVTKK